MTTLLKRNSSAIALVFVAAAALMVLFAKPVIAAPSSVVFQATATATSTFAFMSAGAGTTTYQFDNATFSSGKIQNMQQIDSSALYIEFGASSSASILGWSYEFSNNNIDWYGESASLATNSLNIASTSNAAIQEATTTVTHLWAPGITGTSTKVVAMPSTIPTQHMRVKFFMPVGSAAGGVYAEVDLKKNAAGSQ